MPRSHTVDELRAAFKGAIEAAASAEDLQSLRDQYLGRKQGAVQALLKSIADANRPQMRQTVSWSAGGIIKAKAFSPHHRVFVQRPVLTKLTIATQNGVVSQVGSCTNFCPSAHL